MVADVSNLSVQKHFSKQNNGKQNNGFSECLEVYRGNFYTTVLLEEGCLSESSQKIFDSSIWVFHVVALFLIQPRSKV